jgi:hypothetical protein
LRQVRKVDRVFSVDTEVISIHRTEKWIVRVLVVFPFFLQRNEAGLSGRGRELKSIRRHVAISARASISTEPVELAVLESFATSRHGITRRVVTVELQRAVFL